MGVIMACRILICDEHRLFRDGLKSLLQNAGLEVVGETAEGQSALKLVKKLRPDIVIIDVSIPGLNGIDVTRQLRQEHSAAKVIVMTMQSGGRVILSALGAGAVAYLLKHSAFEELLIAIQAVLKGQTYLSPAIADVVVRSSLERPPRAINFVGRGISIREREVLQQLAEGRSTKEIASALYVSVKTIETHRKQIMDKVNAHNIAALTKYAIREGMISL